MILVLQKIKFLIDLVCDFESFFFQHIDSKWTEEEITRLNILNIWLDYHLRVTKAHRRAKLLKFPKRVSLINLFLILLNNKLREKCQNIIAIKSLGFKLTAKQQTAVDLIHISHSHIAL